MNSMKSLFHSFFPRIDSHSTSDDQTGYQDMDEVEEWKDKSCPITRLRRYIESRGLWDEVRNEQLDMYIPTCTLNDCFRLKKLNCSRQQLWR